MKALVYHGPDKITLDDVPVPKIEKETDAIVRVTLGAICGSDIHIIAGHTHLEPERTVGHEFCGEVVEVGSAVKDFKVGDRVVASCIAYCGECWYCKNNMAVHCTDKDGGCYGTDSSSLQGAQAEYVRVPFAKTSLHHIPDGMSEEQVLFTGDILSTGYLAVRNAHIKDGDTVLVIGNGPVGKSAIEIIDKMTGAARVIVAGRRQSRLDFDKEHGLGDVFINTSKVDIVEEVLKLTDGYGADATIEAIGCEEALIWAVDCCKVGGHVSTIGVYPFPVTLPMERLWLKNLTLSWGFVLVDEIDDLLTLIQNGKIDVTSFITHKGRLNDIVEGYDIFKNRIGNCVKWVYTPYEH